jgi:hypothetical protein
MRRKLPILVIPFTVLLAAAFFSQMEAPVAGSAATTSDGVPAGAAGMRLYVDPDTGEFIEAPPEPVQIEMAQDGLGPYSTSAEGLVEVDSPGAGKMVDLRGRFQQAYSATVDDAGVVRAVCGHQDHAESDCTRSEGEE